MDIETTHNEDALISIKTFSGNNIETLKKTVKALSQEFKINKLSSVYTARMTKYTDKAVHQIKTLEDFEGLVVVLRLGCKDQPAEVFARLKRIEREMESTTRRGVVLNLLAFGHQTLMTPNLTIPHPDLHQNPVDLYPSAEIWGDFVHPVLKENINHLTQKISPIKWGQFFAQGKSLLDF